MIFNSKHNDNIPQDVIIRIGEVVSIYDEYDGLRIKVRLDQDKSVSDDDLPFAFPLLPKTLQTVPKEGEAVLILLSKLSNKESIRYYIGPLLSQPQYYYEEKHGRGNGSTTSLLQGKTTKPLMGISKNAMSEGAFPQKNDVALVGRKGEDIILKDDEVDIRCGIRTEPNTHEDESLKGNVYFNTESPSYIQLKYKRGLCKGKHQVANSVVNVVADKINLISHKDVNGFNLTDQKELIPSAELDEIMSKLHRLPYGDLLVEALAKIINAIVMHVHPYPGLAAVKCENILSLNTIDLDAILSENVRIS